ncbi:MAG: hypothetical protein WCF44_03370 [Candidatus Methylophosphatis roskildensis]
MNIGKSEPAQMKRAAASAIAEAVRLAKQIIEDHLPSLEGEDKAHSEEILLSLDRPFEPAQVSPVRDNVFPFPPLRSIQSENPAESEPDAA